MEGKPKSTFYHEADIIVPGSFVVLQGIPGDGMSNTICTCPRLDDEDSDDDEFEHLESRKGEKQQNDEPLSMGGTDMHSPVLLTALANVSSPTTLQTVSSDQASKRSGSGSQSVEDSSFIVVDEDEDDDGGVDSPSFQLSPRHKDVIAAWSLECRERQARERAEWLSEQGDHRTKANNTRWLSQGDFLWWLDVDGRLAVFCDPPSSPSDATVISYLAPGSTVVGVELLCVDSVTFAPTPMTSASSDNAHTFPRGRVGWIQILRIESPIKGFIVLSIDGHAFCGPGLPNMYMDPNVWLWRVTCHDGAIVRRGLELHSKEVETLPYGAFLRVLAKVVNAMGLARLHVRAIVEDEDTSHVVEGYISEALNPLSGQRGLVAQPVPLPVPALYKVTLPAGAVIRSGVELSSQQVGRAPAGSILRIVGRSFSEHPQNSCVERLQLAGNGGFVSVRLNRAPPLDELVVQLVGIDSDFCPNSPGEYHVKAQLRVQKEQEDSSVQNPDDQSMGCEERRQGDLSEIEGSDGSANDGKKSSNKPSIRRQTQTRRTRKDKACVICLSQECNATLVHGETGHICCCLQCARILKQKGDRCPVCRLSIDSVIQHFYA